MRWKLGLLLDYGDEGVSGSRRRGVPQKRAYSILGLALGHLCGNPPLTGDFQKSERMSHCLPTIPYASYTGLKEGLHIHTHYSYTAGMYRSLQIIKRSRVWTESPGLCEECASNCVGQRGIDGCVFLGCTEGT